MGKIRASLKNSVEHIPRIIKQHDFFLTCIESPVSVFVHVVG